MEIGNGPPFETWVGTGHRDGVQRPNERQTKIRIEAWPRTVVEVVLPTIATQNQHLGGSTKVLFRGQ